MSATDELLRLLDEHDVGYKSHHYLNTSWYAGTKLYMATDNMDGTLTVDNLTPEQAIAATLGDERIKRLENLCRDMYFDLLAEMPESLLVNKLIQMHELGVKVYDDEDYNILLDELGVSGQTCHLIEDGGLLHCSNCGAASGKRSWAYWKVCPNCGAKVVGE